MKFRSILVYLFIIGLSQNLFSQFPNVPSECYVPSIDKDTINAWCPACLDYEGKPCAGTDWIHNSLPNASKCKVIVNDKGYLKCIT